MPGVVRAGDLDSGGGAAQGGVGTVLVNGRPIIVNGSPVSTHPKNHRAVTQGGRATVLAGGRPVNVVGNTDTCGHVRVSGSGDVIVG